MIDKETFKSILSEALEPIHKDIQHLKTEMGSMKSEIIDMNSRFDKLETRFDTLETRFDVLEDKVDNTQQQVATNAEQISIIRDEQQQVKTTLANTHKIAKQIETSQANHERTLDILSRRSIDQEAELKQLL